MTNPAVNLMDLVQPSDINKNLFILPGGAVPPNPTELLARDGLEKAIETLKANFDYVILDTAPVGMVTDTLLIGRTADLSVYVCRADYTRKAEFTLINELMETTNCLTSVSPLTAWIFRKRSTAIIMVMVNTASIMAMVSVMVMAMVMERSIQVGRVNKLLLIKPNQT